MSDARGGPTITDCCHELHQRIAEFQHSYSIMRKRFPDRFPADGLIQTRINRLFMSYLLTGKINESPTDPL